MFRRNVIKEGMAFPETHSYFKGVPKEVIDKAEKLIFNKWVVKEERIAVKKLLRNRLVVGDAIVTRKELQGPITFNVSGIKESINQPVDYPMEKLDILSNIEKHLIEAEYVGLAKDNFGRSNMIVQYHYFKVKVKDYWIVVRETTEGKFIFYDINNRHRNN